MKGQGKSFVLVAAVLVLVVGVAWFRSARGGGGDSAPPGASDVTPAVPGSNPEGSGSTDGGTPAAVATAKLPRVVDVGADKCIPCKMMAPILVELRQEYEGRVIVEFVDVWKDPKAGDPYKIRMIPTQVFYDAEGNEVWRHEGFLPKEDFIAKFAELGVK